MLNFSTIRRLTGRLTAVLALLAPALASAQSPVPVAPISGLPFWEWQVNQPTGYQLNALHVFNDSTLIATGEHGTAVKTANGGRTWQVLPTGVNRALTSVSFATAQVGWMGSETAPLTNLHARYGPGQVLRTADGGQTWTAQALGDNRSVASPQVVAVSATEAYVSYLQGGTSGAPNYFVLPQEPMLRHTTNGGQSWALLALPPLSRFVLGMSFTVPSTGYVLVASNLFSRLRRTTDHGQTWQEVQPTAANGGAADFYGARMSFLDTQRGWVIGLIPGTGPALFRTSNGGQQWTRLALPAGLIDVYSGMRFADALRGSVSVTGADYLTTDGGLTWSASVVLPRQLAYNRTTKVLASGAGWMVGPQGSLYVTADYGQSWRSRATPAPVWYLNALAFPDPTHGWAMPVTDGAVSQTVLRTTRRGTPWRALPPPGNTVPLPSLQTPAYALTDGAFPDADTAWVVGQVLDTVARLYTGLVLRTTDGGRRWARQPLASGAAGLQSVAAWGTRRAIAFDYNGYANALYLTRTGGLAWSGPIRPAPRRQLYRAVWADSATVYVTTDSAMLLKSTTAGRTWQQLPFPSYMQLYSRLTFTSANVGYFGDGDGVWKTTDGARTWTRTSIAAVSSWAGNNRTANLGTFSFRNARVGWAFGQTDVLKTTNAGQTWQHVAYVGGEGGSPCGLGPSVLLDDYNAFGAGTGLVRYSEKFVQADTLAAQPRRYCAGQDITLAYSVEGTLTPAERAALRVQLSNKMGRFRPGQTWLLAPAPGGTATALRATLPATLPAGSRYRLRVITADSALLGGDNGRDLTISPLVAAAISPAGPALTVCQGATATLTAPAGLAQYLWSTGATTRAITVSAAGRYSVQVAGTAGCLGPPSAAVSVTVQPLPAAPVLALAPGGGVAVLTPVAGVTYQWFLGIALQAGVSGPRFPAAGPAPVGSYTAVAVSTVAGGCQSAASAPLVVILAVRGTLPAGWALYPNPADERLYLELAPGGGPVQLTLTDALGRTVRATTTNQTRAALDVRGLPEGAYILRAVLPTGQVLNQAVQVQH